MILEIIKLPYRYNQDNLIDNSTMLFKRDEDGMDEVVTSGKLISCKERLNKYKIVENIGSNIVEKIIVSENELSANDLMKKDCNVLYLKHYSDNEMYINNYKYNETSMFINNNGFCNDMTPMNIFLENIMGECMYNRDFKIVDDIQNTIDKHNAKIVDIDLLVENKYDVSYLLKKSIDYNLDYNELKNMYYKSIKPFLNDNDISKVIGNTRGVCKFPYINNFTIMSDRSNVDKKDVYVLNHSDGMFDLLTIMHRLLYCPYNDICIELDLKECKHRLNYVTSKYINPEKLNKGYLHEFLMYLANHLRFFLIGEFCMENIDIKEVYMIKTQDDELFIYVKTDKETIEMYFDILLYFI